MSNEAKVEMVPMLQDMRTNFREALAKPISMVYDMSVRQSAVRIIMLIVHINILIALTA